MMLYLIITQKDLNDAIQTREHHHHQFYRNNFNYVDIHDRYWYQHHYKFHTHHWRTKMIMGIMGVGLINSWTLFCEKSAISYSEYRKDLSNSLIKSDICNQHSSVLQPDKILEEVIPDLNISITEDEQ